MLRAWIKKLKISTLQRNKFFEKDSGVSPTITASITLSHLYRSGWGIYFHYNRGNIRSRYRRSLTSNQTLALPKMIDGIPVTPVGGNAANAGLIPGQTITKTQYILIIKKY